ncbi:hypothetical protein BO71DRAFT_396769, partial [Aspergillus ellipticus CBS 707.79]
MPATAATAATTGAVVSQEWGFGWGGLMISLGLGLGLGLGLDCLPQLSGVPASSIYSPYHVIWMDVM